MGQYHTIYNKTKKESVRIGGAKLWEQTHSATAAALLLLLSNSNGRGGGDFNAYPQDYDKLTTQEKADQRVIDDVSGRWAGDEIVVQGDYAEDSDPGYINKEETLDYVSISHLVASALLIADNGDQSDVAKIIEEECSNSYSSISCLVVEKVQRTDRNKKIRGIYQATGIKIGTKRAPKKNVINIKRGVK